MGIGMDGENRIPGLLLSRAQVKSKKRKIEC